MKKGTTVRMNRCDHEMNLLFFGCFFAYAALQLFAGSSHSTGPAGAAGMGLYLVFVPGFFFRLGYCFRQTVGRQSEKCGRQTVLLAALKYYVYFFVLAMLQETICLGSPAGDSAIRILSVMTIPPLSAIFFALAVTLFLLWIFYEKAARLLLNKKVVISVSVVCLLSAFLRSDKAGYAIVEALVGSSYHTAVAGLPYFIYVLLGMYLEGKKPRFQWKTSLLLAAGTALSFALRSTALHELCAVTISLFPVYLVYVAAKYLSDITSRFRWAKAACLMIEPVFLVYCVALFGLQYLLPSMAGLGARKALLLSAGLTVLLYAAVLCFVVFRRLFGIGEAYFLKVRYKKTAYFAVYTAAFAVLFALCFFTFLVAGRSLLWTADGVSQYYPRAVYFTNYIRALFSNFLRGNFELPMYDFRIGLGAEVTYSFEPLYFLFAVFGEDKVEFTYNLITVLRFYLAGITSSIFFLYFKKDYITTFIASVIYVFCGFSLFGGARHTMFMIAMIMLPLLILAIEEILGGRRWYLCTIFVALSLFSNYYYLYMNTLAMGIYFLVRFFCQRDRGKRTFKNFLAKGLTVSGSYLLGVAMSCIVLVTTFGLYVGSGRSSEAVIKTPSLFYYSAQWLMRCFLTFLTTANAPGEWLKLGFLPISFFAVVFLFMRKGRIELKVLSVLGVLMMAFPIAGFVFSGFSSVINRWCYMLALLVAYIVADCLPDMKRMTRHEIWICGAAAGIYGFFALFGNFFDTPYTKVAFGFLVITFGIVLIGQDEVKRVSRLTKQSLMLALTVVMVAYNGFSLFFLGDVVHEYEPYGGAKSKAENTPLVAVKEVGDDSFYRVATPKLDYSTISSSIMFDYNSTTMFNSTQNGAISQYLEAMGSTGYSVTQLLGLSNRAFLTALADVKYYAYYVDEDGMEIPERPLPYGYEEVLRTEANGKETVICENKYALPLGYTYASSISRDELEQYDVLQRQEVLMQKVMLDISESQGGEEARTAASWNGADAQITASKLTAAVSDAQGLTVTDTAITAEKKGAKAVFSFQGMPNSETYVVLKNAVLEGDMSEQAINLTFQTKNSKLGYKFRSDDDRYASRQPDYVFHLGYHEEAIDSFTLKFDRAGSIQFDSLEIYSQPMDSLESYTRALTEDVLENVALGTNTVSGDISLESDKILVLSIPYQNGWTAYVDGEKTELQRANYAYMALPLQAGEHRIELSFEIPGVRYALVIMPAAAVLFVLLCTASRLMRRKKNTWKKD